MLQKRNPISKSKIAILCFRAKNPSVFGGPPMLGDPRIVGRAGFERHATKCTDNTSYGVNTLKLQLYIPLFFVYKMVNYICIEMYFF